MDTDTDPQATLAAWRALGADRADPLRFLRIEALARRAASHGGAVRQWLDGRVAELIATYPAGFGEAPAAPPAGPGRGPIGDLVDALGDPGEDGAEPELKALRDFRRDWSMMRVDQRLGESLDGVPGQAGPLNSQHLVHRALALMREVSPDYLEAFMGQLDALLWLDALQTRPVAEPARPRGRRRA